MQLAPQSGERKGIANICALLSTATCSLLTALPVSATEAVADEPWRADIGTVHYSEKDRITVNGITARLKKQVSEESSLSLRSTYDAVSGASPGSTTPRVWRNRAAGCACAAARRSRWSSITLDPTAPRA